MGYKPICWQIGPCFGQDSKHRCTVLSLTMGVRKCPFQKPEREVTGGVKYPFFNFGCGYEEIKEG